MKSRFYHAYGSVCKHRPGELKSWQWWVPSPELGARHKLLGPTGHLGVSISLYPVPTSFCFLVGPQTIFPE